MSGPANGTYLIVSSVDANASIGADDANQSPTQPVLVDSAVKVWTIERVEDGTYKIYLKDSWYSTQDGTGLQLVVDINADPGTRWNIVSISGYNRIETTDGKNAWTPAALSARNAVWINPIANPVDNNQLWDLLPVTKE